MSYYYSVAIAAKGELLRRVEKVLKENPERYSPEEKYVSSNGDKVYLFIVNYFGDYSSDKELKNIFEEHFPTSEEIAADLDKWSRDYDLYGYNDTKDDCDIDKLVGMILAGDTVDIQNYLSDVIEESEDVKVKGSAQGILFDLQHYGRGALVYVSEDSKVNEKLVAGDGDRIDLWEERKIHLPDKDEKYMLISSEGYEFNTQEFFSEAEAREEMIKQYKDCTPQYPDDVLSDEDLKSANDLRLLTVDSHWCWMILKVA